MQFRDLLRRLRQTAKLTEPQLADRAGIPLAALQGYGQGRLPDWDTLVRLADALGVATGLLTRCDEVEKAEGAKGVRPRPPTPPPRPKNRRRRARGE